MNNKELNISDFSKHVFWNYSEGVNLDQDIVIENVILYGDLNDYKKLMKKVSKISLGKVLKDIEKSGRYKKRVNFVKKVLLS